MYLGLTDLSVPDFHDASRVPWKDTLATLKHVKLSPWPTWFRVFCVFCKEFPCRKTSFLCGGIHDMFLVELLFHQGKLDGEH